MDRRDLLLVAGSLSAGLAGCFEQVQRREDQEVPDEDSDSAAGSDGTGGSNGDGSDGNSGKSDGQAGGEDDSVDDGTAGGDPDDGSDSGTDSTGDDSTDDRTDDGPDDATGDDGTDGSTDDGSDDSTDSSDDGSDDSTDDGPDDGGDDGSDDSTDDGGDGSDDGTDDGSEDDDNGSDDDDNGSDDGSDGGSDDGTGTTELPASFTATGMDGFFWTGVLYESDARNGDIKFLPPTEVDLPITIEGDVDESSGTWESTTVFFPVLPVDGGVEIEITAPNGLGGEIDFDTGDMTLEGDLHVDFVDIDASFAMSIEAVTGESGALTGDLQVDGDTGTALLVDNEFVVDEATGETLIDKKMGLPSAVPGDNWFELELDLELTYD